MMRGGPGLGNIAPSAADYFQATRGGGHGDYRTPVLAPAGCQELAELTFEAFDLADKYRTPVVIMGDGLMGQVMEPVIFPDFVDLEDLPKKDWALTGCEGREARAVFSMLLGQKGELYYHNVHLQEKYDRITAEEQRWETHQTEEADVIVVAYGTAARIAESAIDELSNELSVGLFRPITLWPFPTAPLRELAQKASKVAVFELCMGQMVEDVVLSVGERAEIYFYGIAGGLIPTPAEVGEFIRSTEKGDGKVGRRIEV
jgi:2-oxoglutarate ferredoxin oxidoreductase subunit alpha